MQSVGVRQRHKTFLTVLEQGYWHVDRRMNQNELTTLLVSMGCPPEKSVQMALQLDKRAHQLAETKGRSYDEALTHLLSLMKQGWAAKEKGF